MSSITDVLLAANSPEYNTRIAAESHLNSVKESNKAEYLSAMVTELCTEGKPAIARQLAGVLAKNTLDAKDEARRNQLQMEWLKLIPVDVRARIKASLLACLASTDTKAGSTAAQVIAKIAAIELPENTWPELLPALLESINNTANGDLVRKSACEAIGYTCEEVDAEILHRASNEILTAVVSAMRSENADVKLAAIRALGNALEFVKTNMEVENERNYIMQCILEACSAGSSLPIRISAYEALCTCAALYYDKMTNYMQHIFALTLGENGSLFTGDDEIKLQAIEFWSTIGDEEEARNSEAAESDTPVAPDRASCNYIRSALGHLVPKLLLVMTTQEEEENDNTPSAQAANCITIISTVVEDEVIAHVMPFVQTNIVNPDWHFRDAATMAFGSILEGPSSESLQAFIEMGLRFLVTALQDKEVAVRDTTAWCLGRICEFHPDVVTKDASIVSTLITSLTTSCDDHARVACQATWAIYNLSQSMDDDDDTSNSNALSPFFAHTVEKLLSATQRQDPSDRERIEELHRNAYEAIGGLIDAAADDSLVIVEQTIEIITQRLEGTFALQIVNIDDRESQTEVQGLLCGVLQHIMNKLDKEKVAGHCDRIMTCLLQVFQCGKKDVHEEAMMAVGSVATSIGADFQRYMDQFIPILLMGLQNAEAPHVCSISVGVVGDIARSLEGNVLNYCDPIVQQLYVNLQNEFLDSEVKPPILACFGDIALAIGGHFEKYMSSVMPVMLGAGTTVVITDFEDYDMVELVNTLRENLFEGFTGIIQGLKDADKAGLFLPYVVQIMQIMQFVIQDHQQSENYDVIKACTGVVGDLCCSLGKNIAPIMVQAQPITQALIAAAQQSEDKAVTDIAKWAVKQLKAVVM